MLDVSVKRRVEGFTLDATFTAGQGLTALFGPSGSGKSSIIGIVAGLIRPDAGVVRFGGTVWTDTACGLHVPPHRRRIGYVFQEGRLFPHMSVRDNLCYAARFIADARRDRDANLARVAALLKIEPLLGRRPAALSGGEKQRVALGRALMARPQLLLMDEPLSALDGGIKAEIMADIERIRDVEGIPILYVSHAVEEIARLATGVIALEKGHVVGRNPAFAGHEAEEGGMAGGTPLGSFIEATVTGDLVEDGLTVAQSPAGTLYLRHVDVRPGTHLRVHIPANDIILATADVAGLSTLNRLAGLVETIEHKGSATDVTVNCSGVRILARVTRRSGRELALAPGRPVQVLFKALSISPDSLYRAG